MNKNTLKKAISLTGVGAASLFLCFPALAAVNSNVTKLHQEANQFLAQNTSDIDPNVDSTQRNTSPEVNREQNRPGTGSDSDTQQNYTDSDSEPNRIMQNRTGNQNQNYPNNTNNNNNNNRMMQNRTGNQNQNYPNGTNNNSDGGSRLNNSGSNTDNSDTGAIRGMW